MKKAKKILSVLLCIAMLLNLAACGHRASEEPSGPTKGPDSKKDPYVPVTLDLTSSDLMAGITAAEPVTYGAPSVQTLAAALDFSTGLFKNSYLKGENTLISPLSVLIALAMTANGANGTTLEQMETVFGLKLEDLNKLLGYFIASLAEDEEKTLSIADAIWFKDMEGFMPKDAFLQKNADIYKASLYKAPFNETTVKDINDWVKNNTKGMIDKIVDQLSPSSLMFLVNAVAFEAKWAQEYTPDAVQKGTFTNADGSKKAAEYLTSEEDIFIQTSNAVGFRKYYSNSRYSFIALLPSKGFTTEDVIASLPETMKTMAENAWSIQQSDGVEVMLPKFTIDYKTEMSEVLAAMGMPDAFNQNADFSNMATHSLDGVLRISRVLHKTHIEVDETGTKAAAATAIEFVCDGMPMPPQHKVILDRPFVYMLYDEQTQMPFFIGVVNTLEN